MTDYTIAQLDALDADLHFEIACLAGATLRLSSPQREVMIAAHKAWVEEDGLDPDLYNAEEQTDISIYNELRINDVPFARKRIYSMAQLDAMSEDDHWELAGSDFVMLIVSDEQRQEMIELRDEFLDDLASEGIVDQDRLSVELTNAELYHELRINGIDFERIPETELLAL